MLPIKITIFLRIASAFALGVLSDFLVLGDALPYSQRMRPLNHAALSVVGLMLVILFVCSFLLNRRARHTVVIPFTILLGVTITHTIVLGKELARDPTTHNLLAFEYLFGWIIVGLPAFIGALLARLSAHIRSQN